MVKYYDMPGREWIDNAGPDDLRAALVELIDYTQGLEDERDEIAANLSQEEERRDEDEEIAADACDEIAEALGEFMRYNGDAGGEWYRKDARAMLDKMAGALHCLPTTRAADIEALASYTY